MKLEGFPYAFKICGQDGQPIDDTDGYVRLCHGENYSIEFENSDSRRASVTVTTDGVSVGTWVISRGKSRVERPESQRKLFTFYKSGTNEAAQAALPGVPEDLLGLIQVSFSREAPPVERLAFNLLGGSPVYRGGGATRGGGGLESFGAPVTKGLGAGGTGLSGKSSQEFETTFFKKDPDFDPIILFVRLVEDPERKLPGDIQPLAGHRQTRVPPPV